MNNSEQSPAGTSAELPKNLSSARKDQRQELDPNQLHTITSEIEQATIVVDHLGVEHQNQNQD